MLPLFFQVVLGDSATKAGARLIIPSLATPIGGLVTGVVMSRWGQLTILMRTGALFMAIGNALVMALKFQDATWKYYVWVFPANLGQGMVYPAILFTFLGSFEHAGMYSRVLHGLSLTICRSRCICFHGLPYPFTRHCMGCFHHVCDCANRIEEPVARRIDWSTR